MENLEKAQIEQNVKYENGQIDNMNDFHSYRSLNMGVKSSIALHNAMVDSAKTTARTVKYIASKYLKFDGCRIGDFGGGAGFIAHEIAYTYGEESKIYDLAIEASKYGMAHFGDVHFIKRL